MKHLMKLLEFARISDVTISNDRYIKNIINSKFEEGEKFIDLINIKKNYKILTLNWFNNNKHDIIEKIKERTRFGSISEFNKAVEKAFKKIIPSEIARDIDRSGRYALYFTLHNFYLIIEIDYKNLLTKTPNIGIVTVNISPCNNCVKTLIIDEESK